MSVSVQSLPEFVKELPPDIQTEVRDFAEFLMEKRKLTSKEVRRFPEKNIPHISI